MPSDGTADPEINAQDLPEDLTSEQRPAARPLSRRELVAQKQAQGRRNRPFIIGGVLIFLAILSVPIYGFVSEFVLPSRQVAVQVNDVTYTRGDIVDFVRFHQRLALEAGDEFRITDQLLTALETISENEIAYQKAPLLGITVTEEEVQGAIRETIGFSGLSASMAAESGVRSDIAESFRQLLNRIQLSEKAYTEIIRKSLFREKARLALRLKVPHLQAQVHLYALEFKRDTNPDIDLAMRRLATGDSIEQVAIDLSEELAVTRTLGDIGWLPESVLPDLDVENLVFGVNEAGERNLPLNTLSESQWDGESAVYRYYYIDETSDARELDDEDLDLLTDHSLAVWLEDQRVALDNYKLIFNSEIFEWIGTQVLNTGIAVETPTPVPGSAPVDLGDLLEGGN
ncbi:MAG TPA: hypothetical protein QGI07_07830 [Dehalococcoidia bacterium]|jgi:hypothetical protein|nr:hypothetical protein [Chloroflexota bacterium]MDP5876831.1 hypothetical protein [Dehalococcoidia bacterium]MDP7160262.1 hypothetical protein [Dehalococcoidia bacterium]MDP7213415.1 hypothetical protein [Dehalococcoidia bacterium]MDP7514118.1 hypothetical protein [Dehalococcoidia bacterium]|tara:strand:- start:2784 stop:3983 length:1200 start_codon:yes stop_codon:yes gene_type:complete